VAAAKPPIATRKDDVVDRLHGVDVADPYRWLEDADAPEVQRWTDAQNAATRRALDRVPGRAALEKRLWQLYEIGSVGVPVSRPVKPGLRRYFYARRDGKQNQAVLYVRDGAGGGDRALVDVNADRADGTRSLDWWFPSDDGALLAYGVSDDGSEESVLRVRDVATGKDLPTRSRARAPVRSPGRPTAAASTTRATRRRARCPPPRRNTTARSFTTAWATIRRRTASCSATAATRPTGRASICRPTAAGWRSRSARAGRRARSTSSTSAPAARRSRRVGEPAKFSVVEMLDDRLYLFTTSGAPRGGCSRSIRASPDARTGASC
jgi:hypothetical protein